MTRGVPRQTSTPRAPTPTGAARPASPASATPSRRPRPGRSPGPRPGWLPQAGRCRHCCEPRRPPCGSPKPRRSTDRVPPVKDSPMATTLPPAPRRSLPPQPAADGPIVRPRAAPTRRQRKPAWIALALFLILACGGIGLALNLQAGERVAVLAVARPVAVGHQITDQDLGEARISLDPRLATLPASERSRIVGQVATGNLQPGTLLTRGQFSARSVPASGQAVVGVALKPGQMPAEPLRAGDRVMFVRTPSATGTPNPAPAGPAEDAASSVLVPQA